jgi:hypothetical protein
VPASPAVVINGKAGIHLVVLTLLILGVLGIYFQIFLVVKKSVVLVEIEV